MLSCFVWFYGFAQVLRSCEPFFFSFFRSIDMLRTRKKQASSNNANKEKKISANKLINLMANFVLSHCFRWHRLVVNSVNCLAFYVFSLTTYIFDCSVYLLFYVSSWIWFIRLLKLSICNIFNWLEKQRELGNVSLIKLVVNFVTYMQHSCCVNIAIESLFESINIIFRIKS